MPPSREETGLPLFAHNRRASGDNCRQLWEHPFYCPESQIRVSAAECQHALMLPTHYSLFTLDGQPAGPGSEVSSEFLLRVKRFLRVKVRKSNGEHGDVFGNSSSAKKQ